MGLGNGIGIGWPMASSSSSANLGYFTITEICGRIDPRPIMATSQLINTNLYNQGDYVDASDNRGNYFRVCLGGIVLEPSRNPFTISGPTYTSCSGGLVRYQIIQGCNQAIPNGAATQLVNSNLYTYGDYVYSPSFDTRVTLGSIVESFEFEYQIQGPAFNGCE